MTMTDEKQQNKPHVSVAPMMDWTDRHCRYFLRLISPNAWLYTEMVTTGALIHGDADRHLRFHESEQPVALQLGGSNPENLAKCAKMGADYGYNEINLNCGCPSDRVQKGRFGACLMKEPDLVADCMAAMQDKVDIPVTVKCRIGVDEFDDYAFLADFVEKIADKGVTTFVIHARKAWLQGLSPKENRTKPPLMYDRVEEIKRNYPHLRIILNGEIQTVQHVQQHLEIFDGVMIGREAYQNPWVLHDIEREIFGNTNLPDREQVAKAMMDYIREELPQHPGMKLNSIVRHMMGLYKGQPGGQIWRRHLSERVHDHNDEKLISNVLQDLDKFKDAA